MRGSRDLARSLTTLKARYLAVNFIGLAMIASVFVYAGVVELLKWQLAPFAGFARLDPGTASLIKYDFLALAAAQYGIIKIVQKILSAKSTDHLPQAAIITFALCESGGSGPVPLSPGRQLPEFLYFYRDLPGVFLPVFPQIRAVGTAAEGRQGSLRKLTIDCRGGPACPPEGVHLDGPKQVHYCTQ